MLDFSKFLIASDIDGTYLDPHSVVVERNLAALERFRAGGGLFTFSTGRTFFTIDPAIPFAKDTVNAPAVIVNGAALYDFHAGKAYRELFLPERDVTEVLDFFLAFGRDIVIQLSSPAGLYFSKSSPRLEGYVRACGADRLFVRDLATWRRDTAYKLMAFGAPRDISVLRDAMHTRFGDRFELTASGNDVLEVQQRGCTKAAGLCALRDMLTGSKERVLIACGDYENDIAMLRAADISVCPANACDAVKAVADYTLCHCKDGLIADIIERIEAGTLPVKRKTV